jgi:TonB family protein
MTQRFTRAALVALGLALAGALGACSMVGGRDSGASRAPGAGGSKDFTRCPLAERMTPAVDSEYGQAFMGRFSKLVVYPAEAVDAGQGGVVSLCARVTRDGRVHDGRIATGSGYPALDGAALLALGRMMAAEEGTAMPKDFAHGQDSVWLLFPVNFQPPGGNHVRYLSALPDRPCKDTGSKEGDVAGQEVTLKEWGDYPGMFSDAVKQELVYPPEALQAGQSGYTLLCVALDRDSHLIGASISRSSGYPLLDGASLLALGMVQLKAHMPPVPDRVRQAHDRAIFTQEIEWNPKAPTPKLSKD